MMQINQPPYHPQVNEEYFVHAFFTGEQQLFPTVQPIDTVEEDVFDLSDFTYTSDSSPDAEVNSPNSFRESKIKMSCTSKSKGPYIRLGTFAIQIEIFNISDDIKQLDLYKNKQHTHSGVLYVDLILESLTTQKEILHEMCPTCRAKFLKKSTMQTYGPLIVKDKFPIPIHNNFAKFKVAVGCNHNKPKNQQKLCALKCKVISSTCTHETVGSMLVSSGGGSAKSGEVKRDFEDFCKWSALVQSDLKDNCVSYFALLPKSKPETKAVTTTPKEEPSRKRARTGGKEFSQNDEVSFFECVREAYLFKVSKHISSRKLQDDDIEWMYNLSIECYKGDTWKFLTEWLEPTLQTIEMIPTMWTAVAGMGCRLIRGFISDQQCAVQLTQSKVPQPFVIRWSSRYPGSLVILGRNKGQLVRYLLWRHGTSFLLLQNEPKLVPIKDFGGIIRGLYNMQILSHVVDKTGTCGLDLFFPSIAPKEGTTDQVHYNLL